MIQSAADELLEANAEAFDELRAEFFVVNGVESVFKLLKKIEETGTYTELITLTGGHYMNYEELRGQTALKVARADSEFINAYTAMSDFAVDGQIYTVDRRDKEPPRQKQFYYLMYGVLDGNKLDV